MNELDELRLKIAKAKGYIDHGVMLDGAHEFYLPTGGDCQYYYIDGREAADEPLPDWPRDIAAAMALAEEMTDRDSYEPDLLQITGPFIDGWAVELIWNHHDGPIVERSEDAETLPEALCKLWLAWKEGRE